MPRMLISDIMRKCVLGPRFNFMVGHCEIVYFACPRCDVKGSRYPFAFLLTLKAVGMNSLVPSQRQQGLTHRMLEFPQTSKISLLAADQEVG